MCQGVTDRGWGPLSRPRMCGPRGWTLYWHAESCERGPSIRALVLTLKYLSPKLLWIKPYASVSKELK